MAQSNASASDATTKPLPKFTLPEDWLATLIGLVIVLVIGLGLIGPGPVSATLSVAPGECLPGGDGV